MYGTASPTCNSAVAHGTHLAAPTERSVARASLGLARPFSSISSKHGSTPLREGIFRSVVRCADLWCLFVPQRSRPVFSSLTDNISREKVSPQPHDLGERTPAAAWYSWAVKHLWSRSWIHCSVHGHLQVILVGCLSTSGCGKCTLSRMPLIVTNRNAGC
jgi:hypothetical protein